MDLEPNLAPAPRNRPPKMSVGMPETVRIILEDNESIPPTGLFLGLNGRSYMIRPGEPVNVPTGIVEILEHAVMSVPNIHPATKQVIGYRTRHRFPFRRVDV
jgi:hypothetical protein